MKDKITRCLDVTVRVPAHFLGALLIELEHFCVEVRSIGVVENIPFHRNKPRTKPAKKARRWTPAQRKAQAKRMRQLNKQRQAAGKEQ